MIKQISAIVILSTVLATPVMAGNLNTRAAVGGGLGGALGAFIGSEVGGRSGAILGGGLGGALGSVVATDSYRGGRYYGERYYYPPPKGHWQHRHGRYGGYDWDD